MVKTNDRVLVRLWAEMLQKLKFVKIAEIYF